MRPEPSPVTHGTVQLEPLTPAARAVTVLGAIAILLCLPLWAAVGLILQLAFVIAAPMLVLVALLGPKRRR